MLSEHINKLRRFLAAALGSVLLLVGATSCSSWDNQPSQANKELAESLTSQSGNLPDPRSLTGVSEVAEFSEIAPITTNPKPTLPVELVDADGYDVTVEDTDRIMALDLYGTYTKTLIGLGLGDKIVGRTVSSMEKSLADVPVVTENGHSLNVEAVLNLRPTLVILDHSIGPANAIDQIREAGVTTVVMKPDRGIKTFGDDIRNLAAVVGLPDEGETLAKRSEAELEEARKAIAEITPAEPLRMAFLYARGTGGVFFILGSDNGTQDLIEGIGGRDVATEQGLTDITPANAESLAKVNPEVFIMMTNGLKSTDGIEGLLQRPGVAQTIAGQNKRIITIPDGDSLAFGPHTGEVLLRAARALYGLDK